MIVIVKSEYYEKNCTNCRCRVILVNNWKVNSGRSDKYFRLSWRDRSY